MTEHRENGRLAALIEKLDGARVGLVGDLCLDLYWRADMRLSELSRETPHFPLPVVEERASAGGAGNVACNLAALKPEKLTVLGVLGEDWRGRLLADALLGAGVDTARLVRSAGIVTNAYIKPLRAGISQVVYEDPRIDFENREPLPEDAERALLASLEDSKNDFDVLLVSDQLRFGCVTRAVRERICELGREGRTVIVDSRDRAALYRNVSVKPNEIEASRAFGDGSMPDAAGMEALALAASAHCGRPAVVTAGALGCFVAADGRARRIASTPVPLPIDTVGAGDTFLAALGCALAAGADWEAAASLGNLASSVTVRKLGTTGTASREELFSALTGG